MKVLVQEKLTTAIYENPNGTAQDYEDDKEFWKYITSMLEGFCSTLQARIQAWLLAV